MDLKDFVAETLKEISEGVRAAQAAGVDANPRVRGRNVEGRASSGSPIKEVRFDVGVSVSEESGSDAGLRVMIPGISGGLGSSSGGGSTAQNRVQFSVPLALPVRTKDS